MRRREALADSHFRALSCLPLFAAGSGRELGAIARSSTLIDLPSGHVFAREGSRCDEFIVLVSGSVAVVRDGRPDEFMGAGEWWGDTDLLAGTRAASMVIALTDVECLVMSRSEFLGLLDVAPDAMDAFEILGGRSEMSDPRKTRPSTKPSLAVEALGADAVALNSVSPRPEGETMRRVRLAALLFALVALLGACAQDEEPALQEPAETAEATSPVDGATVAVADNDEHGEILVDAEGMTLYVFLQDVPGKSNCNDTCAQTWPPLTVDGEPTAGEGVDDGMLGTIEREDGATQVTYDRPLYNYSGDTKPGDTNGQGVGGNWYVVNAEAEPVKGM